MGFTMIAGVGVYDAKSQFRKLHLVQTMTITPNGYNNPAPTLRMLDECTSEERPLTDVLYVAATRARDEFVVLRRT